MEEVKNTEVNEGKVENVGVNVERKAVVEAKKGSMIVQKIENDLTAAEKELEDVEKELNDAEKELKDLFKKK